MDVVTGAVVKDVVTGAVGSLISKLSQLLNEEYKLQKSVRTKLKSLIEELECAHAALRKVAEVPPEQLDEQVRIWARKVRDASYDMEDVIDTFLVRVDGGHKEHSAGQESFFKRLRGVMPRKLLERHRISGAMDDINKRLEDITRRHGRYTVGDSITVARPASIDPRLAAVYKEVTELVGIEESSSELTAMLSTMKIVSVVGVGGLGKTTLAKSVYEKLKADFECSAFVPIGRSPDLKKVFQDIIREIDKEEYKKHTQFYKESSEQQLIDELRETFLGNKRYLLVIDDVWETRSWKTIKLALVQKNSGSRVITTTRTLEVAEEAGEIYKLKQLPYDKSKKIFYTRIFGAEGNCPDNQLDEVSDRILKKCDGVPLAIITMASLLVGKSREEWIEVCSSFVFRDKDNKQVSDTEWILSLSYYDLPPHLKTCLLYLSVFPEDCIIDKDSLIWMWVAEGFVHNNKSGTSLFEVGTGYFNELINRSMIQAMESEEDDAMVDGCRVHDMVFDLLCLKSQEENFVTISSSNNVRVCRLTLGNQRQVVKHSPMDLGHVRSFIVYWCGVDDGFSFRSFKLLRVLALENCTGGNREDDYITLKHLDNLLHLRYLGIRYSRIDEILEEIGALKFLQTLHLEGIEVIAKKLPSSLGQLTQLICLRAGLMKLPNGVIDKLTSLEQLEICVDEDTVGHFVKDLGKLRELRVLSAKLDWEDDRVEGDLVDSLEPPYTWTSTSSKKAIWMLPRSLQCFIVPYMFFSELPAWISPSDLPNLTYINLRVWYLEDQHLKILGQLPKLRHLKLQIISSDSVAKVTVTSTACTSTRTIDGCFQKLRSLSLPVSTVMFVFDGDSMVLFVLNEFSGVPFTAGNNCIGAPAVMPNLQVLEFKVRVETGILRDNLGLDCLPSLQRVKVAVWNSCCAADELGRDKTALRQAIEGHPNRPTLQMYILGESSKKSCELPCPDSKMGIECCIHLKRRPANDVDLGRRPTHSVHTDQEEEEATS